jgi:farnesyl-diphosphate farnesyltransferase
MNECRDTTTLLERLLTASSRTFALTIPLLPEPTRAEVTVAYLVFRVADTLEDADRWPRAKKLAELNAFGELLTHPSNDGARALATRWAEDPPCDHAGYRELLTELPTVMQVAASLADPAQQLIRTHTRRTVDGMSSFVAREQRQRLQLDDVADLQAYCYAVAGIVGEMLTELFLLQDRDDLRPAAPGLRRDAASFGEALQLVNILKDAASDAVEGRYYLPDAVEVGEVFALARRDLEIAGRYCARLEEAAAPRGFIAFTCLPVLLAWATLRRVEERGSGSKLTRPEVRQIIERLERALDKQRVADLLNSVRNEDGNVTRIAPR